MSFPAITLAIPVYNAEAYVEQSLRSALDQDFELPYEVLVVDDCGTDKSMEVVHHVMEQHPRRNLVRTIRHPRNLGLGAARNTAIDQAHGKYLFFLDADDWLTIDCLSHLYALAEHHQSDVTAGSTKQYQHGEILPRYSLCDKIVAHEAAGVWMVVHDIFMNIEMWNKLFLLDFLRQHHIQTVHRIMEDSVFDFQVRALARSIVLTSHITHFYNIHEISILGNLFGHQATDEAVSTYCDIIHQVQQLITLHYLDIDGIYDVYALRLFYTFHSLTRMQLNDAQEKYVRESLHGFLDFIPSMRSLHQGAFRMAWLACRLKGGDWRAFEHAYNNRYSRQAYYLKRLLQCI